MKAIYSVIHYYDVDGGKHIYDTPYANLYIGELAIRDWLLENCL